MLHPLIRFTFALLIISILSVFTARVIGDAQPPHAWLTWEGADHRTPIDVFISDGRRNVNLTYTPRAADAKPIWSADGRLAWIDDHGQINLWDGERVRSVPPLENTQTVPEFPLVWSPDGRLTWIARDNLTSQLVIAAWAGETSFQLVESAGDSVYPTWSADGRLAWVTSRYPHADQAHVWDGTTTASFALPGVSLDAPIWSADGRLVFVTEAPYGGQGSILVWEEAALVPLGLTNSPYPDLHWSPPMN